MSQPNAVGGHPTSYNTNINRAKTKKWLDAKTVSYDGDDWGDDDEYDGYGAYDEPDPAPKPTGLRQRGQSATRPPQEGYGAGSEVYQPPVDGRQPYDNTSGTLPHHQYGGRSTTNPQSQGQPAVLRKSSFDQGDERRAFSAGGLQTGIGGPTVSNQTPLSQAPYSASQDFQSSPMHPNQQMQAQPNVARPDIHIPTRSSMDAQSRHSDQPHSAGSALRGPQFLDQQRQGSRTHSMTSNNSSLDFNNRRDFSPSAMPPPLHTRGSPSPHSNPDSRSSSRHPPRKSSLSQENPPTLPFPTQGPPLITASDLEEDLPVARERAGSGTGKPLPFVRPADIYKRMQEEKEKEKERKSQESSRLSIDSLIAKQNDPSTPNKPQESEPPQRLKPTLEPVSERKSEYGMEGLNISASMTPEERRPTTSKKFELPNRASNTSSKPSTSSLPQMLPDVSRVSGFGESFFESTGTSGGSFSDTVLNFAGASSKPPSQELRQTAPEKDLRNQPSLGFTSAVHQAFDKAEEQVPQTPSSATGSTVGRSASGGTSVVSPIISRGPSAATGRLPGIADVTTATIAEGPEESNSRPRSSGSPSTLRQYERGPSPTQAIAPESAESPPQSFIPGHRRDLSTPSPDNSPARTPAVESIRQLRQPQEVEIAAATPTDAGFSTSSSSQNSEIAQEDHPVGTRAPDAPLAVSNHQTVGTHAGASNSSTMPDQTLPSTPVSQHSRNRTDSSSSNRVRNLADKFDSGSRPGSAHSTTPRASLLSNATQKKDEIAPPRPIADRMESFRPHLPGGWESSASIAPAPVAKGSESRAIRQKPEQIDSSAAFDPTSITTSTEPDGDQSISPTKPSSSVSQIKDATEEAFSALAEAGSALTGAFAAAVGMDHHDSSTESTAGKQAFRGQPEDRRPNTRDHSTHSNTVVHPEASRTFLPDITNDEMSSEAPTPLLQNAETRPSATSKDPEYFPSPLSVANASDTPTTNSRDAPPAKQQPMLPLLTTDTKPGQYESDRLRKEIVRELTPMSPSEPTTAETDYSNYQDSRVSTNPSLSRPGHESGVIPKEYESYWNDGNSDDELSEDSPEPSRLKHAASTQGQEAASLSGDLLRPTIPKQQAPLPPVPQEQPAKGLSEPVNLALNAQEEPAQERTRTLPHRFSWEQPLHDLSAGPAPSQEPTAAPTSEFLKSAIYPEGQSFQPQVGTSENQGTYPIQTGPSLSMDEPPKPPEKYNRIPHSENKTSPQWEQPDSEKELPVDPPGLEVSSSVGERVRDEPLISGHEDNVNTLAQPSPIDSYNTRSEEHPLPEPPQQGTVPSAAPNTYPGNYILPTLPPKIPAFREIVALKTPAERIRGFNEARDQFARLPVGLQAWVDEALRQLPEHEDLLTPSGRPFPSPQGHKSSPSRSKLGGLVSGGGQAGQISHQQQYLNVSTQPAVFNGPPQSNPISGGSPQAYSPSGGSSGKISSQQVQAKGKDLLHTAGVFGGKANVAAKGLFSKGKSKFRAASGAEKASNLSSPSLPRGMQQQPPSLQAQSATPTRRTLHDGPPTAATEPVTPDLQRSPPSPRQKSPRDSPSLESFTQSQLGDDERSEESGRTSQDQPPRSSTLRANRGSSDAKDEPIEFSATIGDNAPIFLRETPTADSYVGSPSEMHTPRSATSSNKTPTQASFAEKAQLAKAQEKASIRESIERPPKPTSPPQSRFSLPAPQSETNHKRASAGRHDPTFNTNQGVSKEYKETFKSFGSGRDLRATIIPTERSPEPSLQAPKPLVRQPEEETASYLPLQPPQTSKKHGEYASTTTPLLVPRNISQPPRSSQDYSQRGPSIDVTADTSGINRLPSPASQQATSDDLPEQRGRPGPVHYGIDHDFLPRNDQRHVRDYSPAYQGGFQDRVSHDSRQSLEANTLTDSAFWQSDGSKRGTDRPANHHPEQVPDNGGFVQRPQAEQERPDYADSPIERRSESKPRSRRGSRGSAFFKSFGRSSETDQPPLPDTSDVQAHHTPVQSPSSKESKGSRTSILRSLKRNSGSWSGSGRSKENTTPTTSVPQYLPPGQAYQATPQPAKDSPSGLPTNKSKLEKKLQRASTSTKVEQDSGKKKRFSAIGSLFGRSTPKRQSSIESSPLPTQQRPPAQMQQHEVAKAVPPQQLQQYEQGPPIEQPPPEGYYAPAPVDSRHRQSSGGYAHSSARTQQPGQQMLARDAPAYVQNSSLPQRQSLSATTRTYPQTRTVTQTSTTFSRSPQTPSSGVPQSSTTTRTSTTFPRNSHQPSSSSEPPVPSNPRNSSRDPTPRSSVHGSQPSGSSWTRFSSHSRSKSRNSQPQPPSTGTFPPANTPVVPSIRSDSPPPPPPPPKDEWRNSRPQHSTTSSVSTITTMPPSQAPPPLPPQSQPYNHPTPTIANRQSLPPLRTDVGGNSNRNSNALNKSGKGLTPEEKRKSRQQEIERSTLSPQAVAEMNAGGRGDSGDEVVMSATSFPGQMWTPEYAHWEGE